MPGTADREAGRDRGRIVDLNDGIFVIVMTLLWFTGHAGERGSGGVSPSQGVFAKLIWSSVSAAATDSPGVVCAHVLALLGCQAQAEREEHSAHQTLDGAADLGPTQKVTRLCDGDGVAREPGER